VTSLTQWNQLKEIKDKTLQSTLLADDLKLAVVQVQQFLTDVGATRDEEAFADAKEHAEQFSASLQKFRTINPEESQEIEAIDTAFQNYYALGQQMARDYIAKGTDGGNLSMREFDKTSVLINERIDSLRAEKIAGITEAIYAIEQSNKAANSNMLFITVAILAIGATAAWYMSRSILRPLRQLMRSTKDIAGGDLSQSISTTGKDEIGQLALSFEQMRSGLSNLIEKVQAAIEHVSSSSEELSASVEETSASTKRSIEDIQTIAAGADTQMNSTREIATSMEEMSKGIGRIAETSGAVAEASSDMERDTQAGNELVRSAIGQMERMTVSVNDSLTKVAELDKQIGDIHHINETIAEIAARTNLLALNAAIEAARAGEEGRGFGVVAAEIRKLAEQSKGSAEQIAIIINKVREESVIAMQAMEVGTQEVEAGKKAVFDAGQAFGSILSATGHVASQIQEVSAAIEQMSAGSEQIAASILELSDIAKLTDEHSKLVHASSIRNLDMMEEISASANTLSDMAHQLRSAAERFHVRAN